MEKMPDIGCRTPDAECWMLGSGPARLCRVAGLGGQGLLGLSVSIRHRTSADKSTRHADTRVNRGSIPRERV